MAYVYTGESRKKILSVNKTDAQGNAVSGYPKQYNICSSFVDPNTSQSYAAISDTDYARLTITQFNQRLNAFLNKVRAENVGIETDIPNLDAGAYTAVSPSCVVGTIVDPNPGS